MMGANHDGGPAFPFVFGEEDGSYGMSKREWYAGQALKGVLSNPSWNGLALRSLGIDESRAYQVAAIAAARFADAMVEAISKPPTSATAICELLASLKEMTDVVTRRVEDKPGPDDVAARWDRARDVIAKWEQK